MGNPLFSDSFTFYILNIGFFNLKENANLAEFTRKMYFNDAAQVAIFNRFLQIRGFSVFKTMKVVFFLSRSAIPFRTQFNPIPAGVLENQDTLGGGQFAPPL